MDDGKISLPLGNQRLFNIARANRGGTLNVGVPEERRERRERRRPGIVRLRYYIQGYPDES